VIERLSLLDSGMRFVKVFFFLLEKLLKPLNFSRKTYKVYLGFF